MKAIVTCACAGAPKYCDSAFKVLFPGEPLPNMYIKSKAKELLEIVPEGSEIHFQVSRILRRKGRYGFYFEYDETGKIVDCWNLLRHKRVV